MRYLIAIILILGAVAVYARDDMVCRADTAGGPKIASTMLIYGCER